MGTELLSVPGWIFLLPLSCYPMTLITTTLLKILTKLCILKPVLHNFLWLHFVLKNFESALKNNAVTVTITYTVFNVWEVFVLFLVLQQFKSSELLFKGAGERKEGIFFFYCHKDLKVICCDSWDFHLIAPHSPPQQLLLFSEGLHFSWWSYDGCIQFVWDLRFKKHLFFEQICLLHGTAA